MARVVGHCRRWKLPSFCPANNSSLISVVGPSRHSGLVVKAGNRITWFIKVLYFFKSVVITSRMQSLGCSSLQWSAPDKPDLSFWSRSRFTTRVHCGWNPLNSEKQSVDLGIVRETLLLSEKLQPVYARNVTRLRGYSGRNSWYSERLIRRGNWDLVAYSNHWEPSAIIGCLNNGKKGTIITLKVTSPEAGSRSNW